MDCILPAKLDILTKPGRYKILYGGRGGAKSHGVARTLLALGAAKPIRVLCAREYQSSIKDSVHRLLADCVEVLGLQNFYTVQQASIVGKNGTEFGFAGLRHNISGIKSYEGADIAWVEEAQTVSNQSWDVLIPTIRKEGSQIWATFNPDLDSDATYKRFVLNPPPNADVAKIGWEDNPWFPATLHAEMQHMFDTDPDAYSHVWGGNCRQCLDGAVYAKELRDANDRITSVPYNPAVPVHCAWDLGNSDSTSIIMFQAVGLEYHIIDFLQDHQRTIQSYISELQARGYVWGVDIMPHDSKHQLLAAGGVSIKSQMQSLGRTVVDAPHTQVSTGIDAARGVLPICYFDQVKCADLIQNLRHYRYGVNELGQYTREPLHDINSHAADAFRYFALGRDRAKVNKWAPIKYTNKGIV